MSNQHKIAISYAWKAENGGPEADAVEQLCNRFRQKGIFVLRDKDDLKVGSYLREFTRRIGTARFLCVFLSDAYLRSPSCMNELLIAWDYHKSKPHSFRRRVKVWVMSSANEIFAPAGRIKYTEYWKKEQKKLRSLLKPHLANGVGSEEFDNFRLVQKYAKEVNEILTHITSHLSAPNFAEFEDWVQSDVRPKRFVHSAAVPQGGTPEKVAISTNNRDSKLPTDEAALAQRLREVFPNQIVEIERILIDNVELRTALIRRTGIEVETITEREVTEKLWVQFHLQFLRSIGLFLQLYDVRPDKRIILELISMVIMLSMCPNYAAGIAKDGKNNELAVPMEAYQGIGEMLLCWTRDRKLNLRSPIRSKTFMEIRRGKHLDDLKRDLAKALGIDPGDSVKLEDILIMKKDFGEQEYRFISEIDADLIAAIRADTALRHLFLLIRTEGHSVRPEEGCRFDWKLERYIEKTKERLTRTRER